MSQLHSAQLPRNGYIVSLLLWAASQKKKFEMLNEAVFIQSVMDFLLAKHEFGGALRGEFDARSKEILLQALALHFSSNDDFDPENNVLKFVISFLKKKDFLFSQ